MQSASNDYPMQNRADGDVREDNSGHYLHKQTSEESVSSTVFPWHKFSSRRNVFVSRGETGRSVQVSGFFLCLMSVLLLCSGIILCGASIWTMLTRLPYSYLFNKAYPVNTNTFNLCSGIIGILCFWIACTTHDNRKNYLLLPLLVILLALSLVILSASVTIGVINRTKITFIKDVYPLKLAPGAYKSYLNHSMHNAMLSYNTNYNIKHSWDKVQKKLGCCGVGGFKDWERNGFSLPKSCYTSNGRLHEDGCIDPVGYDTAWHICILTGFTLIVFGTQIVSLLLASYLYLKEKINSNRPIQLIAA